MTKIAIQTNNLGKQFKLGETINFSRTMRETIMSIPKSILKNMKSNKYIHKKEENISNDPEILPSTFWALRDINLEIRHGDSVGLIGPNGAGKSTLLKVLLRITLPTEGRAIINGKTGSIIEVGTGFHPELTGKENIYLYGSILGMKKKEIEKKYDEIVDFSGVEKFLETPVKRFSSGMHVRLAFAVAAHLDPDILFIDEVLSVGDDRFQKKCIDKMTNISKQGKTIIFVSHNMPAVRQLCNRAVILNKGRIVYDGTAEKAVSQYMTNME